MQHQQLGRTDLIVSRIGFGAWAIGGDWGGVDDEQSMAAMHAAIDAGVNFVDTADAYGDGRSERLVARLRRERPGETIHVATKAGRRLPKQVVEGYSRTNLTGWINRSLRNLETEQIDLLQLHCPPTALYQSAEVFDILDDFVRAGKVRYDGVSVETVEEALASMHYPHVQSIQIIFNMFRLKPLERVSPEASRRKVGILARVPLARGLLTGKLRADSVFPHDDHRNYNRAGEAFDQGETLSGVPYTLGSEAVERLRPLTPQELSLPQFALRWILMFDAVTTAIPGAKTPAQAKENASAGSAAGIDRDRMAAVEAIYNELIEPAVHSRW